MNTPKFTNTHPAFHQELKRRVNQYFVEAKKATTGNWKLYWKAILLGTAYLILITHLLFFTPENWIAILECLILGFLTAAIGFNVMHDGSHGSFSKRKYLNRIAAITINMLGASGIMWNQKHNILHHTYTNISGVDDDIEARPFLRLCTSQKRYKMHKYQHVYFWFLYTLLHFVWVFKTDFEKYFTRKIGKVPIRPLGLKEHFGFWAAKIVYLAVMVVFPIIQFGFWKWLIGFLLISLTAGFLLSIVFQLAHTVEHTEFPVPVGDPKKIENEWAIHQIQTTANFATRNRILSWLVGGLNFQIEHHLFPKISHVHYPEISKIIRQTCAEFGLQYIEYPKMRLAIASHVNYLKKLGEA